MNLLLQNLEKYGCDIDGAMERFLNDEELYMDCLDMALNDPLFEGLGEKLSGGTVSEAFDAAHTLKGVMANMGLSPILSEVVEIVEPLRSGTKNGLDGHYQEMLHQREAIQKIVADSAKD